LRWISCTVRALPLLSGTNTWLPVTAAVGNGVPGRPVLRQHGPTQSVVCCQA
jgi:hypothetical protein